MSPIARSNAGIGVPRDKCNKENGLAENAWELPAKNLDDYFCVHPERGREFVLRLPHGADPLKAIEKFAVDNKIRFAKVHAAFMGAFRPAKYMVWTPDTKNPDNWHNESVATTENLSMLLTVGGMIGIKKSFEGDEQSFVAMHFVAGGAWDTGTFGGHLYEGTRIAGTMCFFVTEMLNIDVIPPTEKPGAEDDPFPENWYYDLK